MNFYYTKSGNKVSIYSFEEWQKKKKAEDEQGRIAEGSLQFAPKEIK